jgi:hypothetical protein
MSQILYWLAIVVLSLFLLIGAGAAFLIWAPLSWLGIKPDIKPEDFKPEDPPCT